MELRVIEKKKNFLKVEIIGEDHTFCNILRKHLTKQIIESILDYGYNDTSDLLQSHQDSWEETNHWEHYYGNDLIEVAQNDENLDVEWVDIYSEIKVEWWEGYYAGLGERGLSIIEIIEEAKERA